MAPARPILCLVTDRHRLPEPSDTQLVELAARAAAAGVGVIHVRERDLPSAALVVLVRRIVDAVRGTPSIVLVNDRADVALAAGAHGVHLREDSVPAGRVRGMSPPGWIVSRAVHSTEGAVTAEREGGVDFLVFGTVFPSAGKDAAQRPAGLDGLRDACAAVRLPVVAIGGMTAPRARAAAATGAAGVAAIGLFVPGDPSRDGVETLVRDLRRSFDTSSQVV